MAKAKDLMASTSTPRIVGDYNVTEPGWYAVDDGGRVVLGPFTSLAECERRSAIACRPSPKSQIPPTPT